jgi:hypothetical protein
MPIYVNYMEVASYFLGAGALVCWFVTRSEAPEAKTIIRLVGYAAGGFCLVSYGLTLALPSILSPREVVAGPVAGFRQVPVMRGYSRFEFSVQNGSRGSPALNSDYFDKGFYSGDPLVYDGATVKATYLAWTGEVVALTELSGRHAGWSFSRNPSTIFPWILVAAGIIVMFGGGLHAISDRLAKPPEPRGGQPPNLVRL